MTIALQKTITLDTGVIVDYFKMLGFHIDDIDRNELRLWLGRWISKDAHDSGKPPFDIDEIIVSSLMYKDNDNHIITDYNQISTTTCDPYEEYFGITVLNALGANPISKSYEFLKATDKYYDSTEVTI